MNNNNNIRVAHCTKLWHQSGGYKLSQYIGSYFPDSLSTRPDGSQVWIGQYVYFSMSKHTTLENYRFQGQAK
jgi:hypothetical protein